MYGYTITPAKIFVFEKDERGIYISQVFKYIMKLDIKNPFLNLISEPEVTEEHVKELEAFHESSTLPSQ